MTSRFQGTDSYVATEDLMMAVNASVTLGRPLLVKGEPGTGKTQLAEEVARSLNRPLYRWHIKSTTKAQQGEQRTVHGGQWPESLCSRKSVHGSSSLISSTVRCPLFAGHFSCWFPSSSNSAKPVCRFRLPNS